MQNHPLFHNVDLKHYKKQLHITKYSENTLLFSEGETCKNLGIVLSGELTISTLTSKDNEYVINILGKNDIFGDTLLFTKNKEFLGDVIVTKKAEILYIPYELLLQLFTNQTFLLNFLKIISEKNTAVRQRLKLYSQKNIENRIMFFLLSEKKRLKTNIIPIKSKEKLAIQLNIPRPSLSRELIKLKEKNIIDYDKYTITLKENTIG